MIFDAFSSDAVPIHLLTREALALYESKLAPSGWLAFHTSNAHLGLSEVLAALAADRKLACIGRHDLQISEEEFRAGKTSSTYVVLARRSEELKPLAAQPQWQVLSAPPGTSVWTDDYSNIVGAFMWNGE
jgi:hypothetical protein